MLLLRKFLFGRECDEAVGCECRNRRPQDIRSVRAYLPQRTIRTHRCRSRYGSALEDVEMSRRSALSFERRINPTRSCWEGVSAHRPLVLGKNLRGHSFADLFSSLSLDARHASFPQFIITHFLQIQPILRRRTADHSQACRYGARDVTVSINQVLNVSPVDLDAL